jgi:hypothetical protein
LNTPPPLNRSRGLSVAQLVVSIIGLVISSIGLFALLVFVFLAPQSTLVSQERYQQFPYLVWILFLVILLAIPSILFSVRDLKGYPKRPAGRHGFLISSLALPLFIGLFFLGRHLASQSGSGWVLAPIDILLVLLPIWWIIEFGRLQLPPESAQRRWGAINVSVFLTMPVIMLVEIFVLFFILVLGSVWLIGQPEFAPVLQGMTNSLGFDWSLLQNPQLDFLPLLQKPEVIFAGLVIVSLIIPVIEEALKPLAVWSIFKRQLTPSGGFIAGLICGAAFALVESSFSLSAASGQDWGFAVIGRLGTGLLHAITAGLNGWALATTWQDKNYLRQGLVYALTVALHGTWNFFAIFMGISQVGADWVLPADPILSQAAPWVLAGLALALLAVLFAVNRLLRRRESIFLPPPVLPPPLPLN